MKIKMKNWFYKLKLYPSLMLTFNSIFILAVLIILATSAIITGKITVKTIQHMLRSSFRTYQGMWNILQLM